SAAVRRRARRTPRRPYCNGPTMVGESPTFSDAHHQIRWRPVFFASQSPGTLPFSESVHSVLDQLCSSIEFAEA
ncbi:hypothetical protein OE88DRAFT_1667596, partial [Heliocybe sulcata]